MPKSPDKKALRESGAITAGALKATAAAADVGVTTAELDRVGEEFIRKNGGVPAFLGHRGFPNSVCTSVNAQVVHGIPGDHKLRAGDVLSIDLGVKVAGWYTDAALTVGIGQLDPAAAKLIRATWRSLEVALAEVSDGRTTGDLGAAVQKFVEAEGLNVVRDCVGHGIGQKLHQEPSIPNYGRPGSGTTFRTDMVVAIEPMVVIGDPALEVAADRWTMATRDRSLAAHFEETVIVTDGAPERLTPLEGALPGEKPVGKLGKAPRLARRPKRSEGTLS